MSWKVSVVSEGGRLELREANVFFLRCLDLKEILATVSHLLPVRCQQTMLVPRNMSGRFQGEFGRKNPESTERAFSLAMTHIFKDQIGSKPPFLWKVEPWNKMRPTTSPLLLHPTSLSFLAISERGSCRDDSRSWPTYRAYHPLWGIWLPSCFPQTYSLAMVEKL